MSSQLLTWLIAALATAGVILRPFRAPEAVWAVAGAAAITALGLLTPGDALRGVAKGTDVYFFLTGMMLLAELARREGLFDWLAALAAEWARGSALRLFGLIYLVGIGVTVFLSNDATAVVLTPAVAAVARAARARDPLPYLLICAFVANAASFVLPISNPANLVIYGARMPPLLAWLPRYSLPSALAIGATYLVLRFTQRRALREPIATDIKRPALRAGGRTAAYGIGGTALALLAASALGLQLGLATFLTGSLTVSIVLLRERSSPWGLVRHISWSVLPLVAGLFVLVEALAHTGAIDALADALRRLALNSPSRAGWAAGVIVAVVSNLMNNLPAGLIAAGVVQAAYTPDAVTGAALIGVDIGPNLSVTGSLATILWLSALRRESLTVGAWAFLRLGLLVMPPALLLALAGL